jgi:fatty-acyl-CoA synthase
VRRGRARQWRAGASTGPSSASAKPPETTLPQAKTDDIAYLQYSSGSTRFPHGVAITHHALLNNLAAHSATA